MATTPGSSDTLRRYFEAYNTHDSEAVRRGGRERAGLAGLLGQIDGRVPACGPAAE